MTITSFFFIGGIVGGIFYSKLRLLVLTIAAGTLISGIISESIKMRLTLLNRKSKN